MLKVIIQDYIPKELETFFIGEKDSRPDFEVNWHESGAYGSIEWSIPTAIIILFSKDLFGGFLSEAGKDLYSGIKVWLNSTVNKARALPVKTISNVEGKLNPENTQSKGVSFEVKLLDKRRLKFLFDKGMSDEQVEIANLKAFEMVIDYFRNEPSDQLTQAIGSLGFQAGFAVFGLFDLQTNNWTFTDIRQEAIRTGKIKLGPQS